MATQGFPALLAVTIVVSVLVSVAAGQTCSSLTGGFNNGKKIFLFFGTAFNVFDLSSYKQTTSGKVSALFKGLPNIPLDGAYHPVKFPHKTIILSGDKFYRTVKGKVQEGPMRMRKKFPRNKAFARGIDAVATQGRRTYYFKGCVVNRKEFNGNRHLSNIKRMGLPCHIDAAWNSEGKIVVTKGPFAWLVDPRARRSRPHCFYCRSKKT